MDIFITQAPTLCARDFAYMIQYDGHHSTMKFLHHFDHLQVVTIDKSKPCSGFKHWWEKDNEIQKFWQSH